ncbi:hypothetical protein MKK67_03185, partial [Methylobacterium sp. J-072]|nr:hypothetical protein [Methylobacterium sp. J-072]
NTMGGEDTFFFHALLRAGHKIAWAPDAIVYDSIPAHRMRVRWLLARWPRWAGCPGGCRDARARAWSARPRSR